MPLPFIHASRPALIVMGVSGAGKSVCGAALAHRIGLDFIDGDALHPTANVAKMSHGQPLSDEDRWPWLDRVGAVLAEREVHPNGLVVACSALRRRYRDRIRRTGCGPIFVFLDITPEVARARLAQRPGHFMPVGLLDSQFETLEIPGPDEADVLRVQQSETVEATVETAVRALRTTSRS